MILKKIFYLIILIFIINYVLYNCSNNSTQIFSEEHDISINVIPEVTESWIRISVENISKNATYYIMRDDTCIFKGKIDKSDTLFHDTGLTPNKSYAYQMYGKIDGKQSQIATDDIITMDTTGQNFEFNQYTVGSGDINDVTILNENNIWAVGSFYIDDTLYSVLNINDDEWKLFPATTKVNGKYDWLGSEIDKIITIDEKNVFLFNGPIIIKWDGESFTETLVMQDYWDSEYYSYKRSVWKDNNDNFILGDYNGNIIFTNGYIYSYFNSGIQASVYKIWGRPKLTGYGYDIFAVLGQIWEQTEQNILRIEGTAFYPDLNWPQDGTRLFSIWFKNMNKIFVSKSNPNGVATYGLDKKWTPDSSFTPPWLVRNLHGNDINDIWATGEHHYMAHFNGMRWKNFPEMERFGPLYGMDVKGDIMVAGGYNGSLIIVKRK